MSDSVQPHRWHTTRLPCPWDSPGKKTGVDCHFLLQCLKVKSESEVAQSCPTLSDPMDCSPPGSSIHRIFQARVLEWGAIAFSEKSNYYELKINKKTNISIFFLLFTKTCPFAALKTLRGNFMTEIIAEVLHARFVPASQPLWHGIRVRAVLGMSVYSKDPASGASQASFHLSASRLPPIKAVNLRSKQVQS